MKIELDMEELKEAAKLFIEKRLNINFEEKVEILTVDGDMLRDEPCAVVTIENKNERKN